MRILNSDGGLIGRSRSNAEIVADLRVGRAPSRLNIDGICTKVDLCDRPGAIVCAFDLGLTDQRAGAKVRPRGT